MAVTKKKIKLLFLADTHLGFDYPFKPRIQKTRRGNDFFANYKRALSPAFKKQVDAVIHGGDLLFRSRVPARLVDMAMEPLKKIADSGIDVYMVPGNHERSRIPYGLLSIHPHIHIFASPQTFILKKNGFRLALAGFPYWYDNVRLNFPEILKKTKWKQAFPKCDAAILCVHHCFEGATVGPSNYTFRYNDDVIRHQDIPREFSAVLSGHIHRFQVLKKDLKGHSINTPVFYPGSIERTSFAEKDENKGYIRIDIESQGQPKIPTLDWSFCLLPTRPMVKIVIPAQNLTPEALQQHITKTLHELDPQSVVNLSVNDQIPAAALPLFRAAALRAMSPPEMTIQFKPSGTPFV